MTISELIANLEEVKKVYGDINVRVQYRDDSGPFAGSADPDFVVIDKDDDDKYADVEDTTLML